MAKKFMFVCFGILALAIDFHLGAQYGSASIVDHSVTGMVALSQGHVLLDNGEVWRTEGEQWERVLDKDPPIPVESIRFWEWSYFVSTDNEFWWSDGMGGWMNLGYPPTGPTPTQSATWGEIKAEFGE